MLKRAERKNHRLKNFDYGSYGYYYVTICTRNRMNLLSEITQTVGSDALVAPKLTKLGMKILESWNKIAELNENVEIDKFVFMPNHIHGIIVIKNSEPIYVGEKKFDFEILERRGRRSLPGLVKDFKSVTTRIYKSMFSAETSLWQESFFDEVIRSQAHYNRVWKYIDENPVKWEQDELFL